jgi:branched-chain amino acid transport system substrate-binding protein
VTQPNAATEPWRGDVEAVKKAVAGRETVRIGVLTPLSPPGDPMAGTLIVRGARLGAEYIAEHGGIRGGKLVDLMVENDQATASYETMARSAVGGLGKLALLDEVLAVLGQWHLRAAPWVADAAARLGLPIFTEIGHNGLTRKKQATTFRTYFTVDDRMPLILDFLKLQGCRRVAIVAANTVFGLMFADALAAHNASGGYGFEIKRIEFDQETTFDLTGQLEEVKRFRPDFIFNGGVVRTNYLLLNQAYDLGLFPAIPMMVTFPFPLRSDDYWRLAGEKGNFMVWPATPYRPSMAGLTEIGRWFTERYLKLYGSFPPDNALSSFTDVTILGQALDHARSETREALIEALESQAFDSWRGPIEFKRGAEDWHHSPPPVVLMQYHKVGQSFDEAPTIYPPEARSAEFVRA